MAKTDYQSIDEYQSVFPAGVQERMQTIRDIIHEIVPEVEEVISYQIPCFKYKGYLIYYAAFARHISLSYPYSKELLAQFETQLKEYSVSKSAIQFPDNKPLPLDLIRGIITFRVQENIQNEVTKPKKKKAE